MSEPAATLALLDRLIAIDTTSSRSNLALIDFAADHLRACGAEVETIPAKHGAKASLFATIGPAADGGVLLAGHSDVVPVEGQSWASDPFRLDARDGRAYGRGTADMKGFLACVLAAAPAFATRRSATPVHVAITFDEEVGCIGAPELIAWLDGRRPMPAIAIVGEPTSMAVVDAHKGIFLATTTITGAEAHSSLSHQGVSAIALAARAMALLSEIERELADARDPRFAPERTTISINRIDGGTAVNILAGRCAFTWDVRAVPAVRARDVLARFADRLEADVIAPARARFPAVSADTAVIADAPGLAPEPNGPAMALAVRLTGSNQALAVPYAAEAGQYQAAGLSTVIVGPGSIEQAHKADEWVALEQLARCDRFMADLSLAG